MKKIGFIDYYISEWHADNYPQWIKDASEKMNEDFVVAYAWAELDKSLVDGVTTDEWCNKFNVERCNSIEELCEKSDYVLVLAPTNPETHLGYAKQVLKYKKNTYIDKTFAPDYATAKEIFDIAEKYGTKFFSTSALRFATELDEIKDALSVDVRGGGSNIEEYIIHQIEMAVRVLKKNAVRVRVEDESDNKYTCYVDFGNDEISTLYFAQGTPFSLSANFKDGIAKNYPIESDFFVNLLSDILRFFVTGETSFDVKETLEVMKIREAVVKGVSNIGEWIAL